MQLNDYLVQIIFSVIHETVCRNSDDILPFKIICLSSHDVGAEIRYPVRLALLLSNV